MALSGAFRFIKTLTTNNDFRQECFRCKSKNDLLQFIENYGIQFSTEEFSDAINASLLKCQTEEDALEVKQIEWLFHLLP